MKKIVGILAAAAMAGSLFAVDMSAALKFNGSIFNSADKTVMSLEQPKAQKGHGQTGIDLTVSADKAGATLILGNGYGGGNSVNYEGFKMWVQPADFLKINLGELDYCLNKESIDYAGCLNGAGGQGFGIDITPVDGLTLNVVLNPGYGAWMTDGAAEGTNVYAKYATDAGTFGVAYLGSNNFADNKVSASYSNNFSGVDMFADFAYGIEAKAINADLFVKGNADAFGYAVYVDFGYVADTASLGAKGKFTYNMGSCTPYVYVKCANFMADPFAMTLKPGVNFNIGAAGVEIAADVSIGSTTSVNIPFGISLNF
ncbi:MAG: hypothetical protein MJ160_03475 [Treponema sp.]|nr:hypothetical protein [Treponema sp.]